MMCSSDEQDLPTLGCQRLQVTLQRHDSLRDSYQETENLIYPSQVRMQMYIGKVRFSTLFSFNRNVAYSYVTWRKEILQFLDI